MTMPSWEELPASLRTEEVRPYYEALARRLAAQGPSRHRPSGRRAGVRA